MNGNLILALLFGVFPLLSLVDGYQYGAAISPHYGGGYARLKRQIARQQPASAPCSGSDRVATSNGVVQDLFSRLLLSATATSSTEVVERVKDVVAEQLGVDRAKIQSESSFIGDLGADSLDSVELVMAFEEKFGVSIPDEEASKIKTVQDAVDYISAHKATGGE